MKISSTQSNRDGRGTVMMSSNFGLRISWPLLGPWRTVSPPDR